MGTIAYGIENAVAYREQVAERLLVEAEVDFKPEERAGIVRFVRARSGRGLLAVTRPGQAWDWDPTEVGENPGLTQVVNDLNYRPLVPKWTLLWAWLSPTGPASQCPEFVMELCGRILDGSIASFQER